MNIFGTDGIRGKPFEFPLSPAILGQLGQLFSRLLAREMPRYPQGSRLNAVLFARDTRTSGPDLLEAVSRGFMENGWQAADLGILPTPALAYLVPACRASLGCVISASHNPPEYNGVKFFNAGGRKIPEQWERAIENWLQVEKAAARPSGRRRPIFLPPSFVPETARRRYLDFLRTQMAPDLDLRGLKIAVDGANGAAARLLPELLRSLGAEVVCRGAGSSGRNINVACGALHPSALSRLVCRTRCHIGFALDGDGDRLIVVDENGRPMAGEWLLATIALERRRLGEKGSGALVTTQVSNFALRRFLAGHGIGFVETKVGDRRVLDALEKEDLGFGGENSGHFIWPYLLPSADGMLAALIISQMVVRRGKKTSAAIACFPLTAQARLEAPSPAQRPPLENLPVFLKELGKVTEYLGSRGRSLVRYSGTEPVLRILLEGELPKARLNSMAKALKSAYLKAVE
ncbi:MAG: phosphoglucosamine mutase [Elusimicrobia bacterium]|nr:phosphoglucosamine mutase [Elusimicrobiota bacterium]